MAVLFCVFFFLGELQMYVMGASLAKSQCCAYDRTTGECKQWCYPGPRKKYPTLPVSNYERQGEPSPPSRGESPPARLAVGDGFLCDPEDLIQRHVGWDGSLRWDAARCDLLRRNADLRTPDVED